MHFFLGHHLEGRETLEMARPCCAGHGPKGQAEAALRCLKSMPVFFIEFSPWCAILSRSPASVTVEQTKVTSLAYAHTHELSPAHNKTFNSFGCATMQHSGFR